MHVTVSAIGRQLLGKTLARWCACATYTGPLSGQHVVEDCMVKVNTQGTETVGNSVP